MRFSIGSGSIVSRPRPVLRRPQKYSKPILTNLSLSPSQSQAKPSQAKAWAEVFYIITMCPVPCLSRAILSRKRFNISASTEQNQTKLSGYSRTNPGSRLVTKIFTPPKLKPDFWAKKGVKPPKISQKLYQLGFGSNFQVKLKPINDQNW